MGGPRHAADNPVKIFPVSVLRPIRYSVGWGGQLANFGPLLTSRAVDRPITTYTIGDVSGDKHFCYVHFAHFPPKPPQVLNPCCPWAGLNVGTGPLYPIFMRAVSFRCSLGIAGRYQALHSHSFDSYYLL